MKRRLAAAMLGLTIAMTSVACGSDDDGGETEMTPSPAGSITQSQPPASSGAGPDAFLIYREASGDLIAQNLASGERFRQTVDFQQEVVVNVQCTPDGSRMAYLRQRFDRTDREVEIRGTDSPQEPLSISPNVQGVSWSPDGTRMAIAEYDGASLKHSLAILDVATGEMSELASGVDFAGSIAWSPAGERLAYYLQSFEENTTHVYVLPTGGGEPAKITEGARAWYDPDWSPDGQRLLVAGVEQDNFQLYEVNADTGEQRQVTDSDIFKRGARYSPDGSTIAYTGSVVEPQVSRVAAGLHSFGIFLLGSDGTGERAFTADPRENPGADVDPNLDAYFMSWCAPGPWLDDLWTPAE